MQSSPKMSSTVQEEALSDAAVRSRRTADRVYQGLTLAAMLLLLVSLWVF
jgi:hypothetical protein